MAKITPDLHGWKWTNFSKKIVKKVLQLVTHLISKLVAHFSSFSFKLKNVFSLRSNLHDSFLASVDERRRRTSKLIDVFLHNSKVTYACNLYVWVGWVWQLPEYLTDDDLINSQNVWLCCIQQYNIVKIYFHRFFEFLFRAGSRLGHG